MKSLSHIIYCLALLLLSGCNSDPDIVDYPIVGVPISLSATVDETRGSELLDADFTKFWLSTYNSDGTEYFTTTVSRSATDGSCSFDSNDTYVWGDDALTFYGLYPYDTYVPTKDAESGNMCVTYTSSFDPTYQKDLVVEKQTSSATSSVALGFLHALSKLNFTLTIDNDEVNIKDVKLSYCYKQLAQKGVYNFDTATWSPNDGEYSDLFNFALYTPTTLNETHTYDETLFVIPQSLSSSKYISVKVEYGIYNDTTLNHTAETGYLSLVNTESLSNAMATEWVAGYEYTYNLNINASNEISATLTIDTREEVVAQGNINLQYLSDYSDTNDRIAQLWSDGVDDFVVAGKYTSGILGYGSISCPFITGIGDEHTITYRTPEAGETATHIYDDETEEYVYAPDGDTATHVIGSGIYVEGENSAPFSVDMRLMYNLPSFTEMHGGAPDNTGDPDSIIDGDAPSFPKYIFQYAQPLKEVILPEDVIAIGDYAFQGSKELTKINMFGAKHVEKCAFQSCENLTEVITSGTTGTLTRIHDNGFDGCTSLTSINLGNIREIDQYGFVNCSSLGVIDLSRVTVVGKHAFDGCSNMDIPESSKIPNLETISDYAFAKCATLGSKTDIVIDDAIYIGDHAFNGCKKIQLGDYEEDYDIRNVYSIGSYAFQECELIENIDISNVTYIGSSAFYKCTSLMFANGETFSNLTHIGDSAFQLCPDLCANSKMTIVAPNIETLGAMAFVSCSDFDFTGTASQDFTGVTSIEPSIFGDCIALDNPLVFIYSAITSIGEESFAGCTLLPSVTTTAANISSIGSKAFYYCTSIEAFEIAPSIITNRGSEAFMGCDKMVLNGGDGLSFPLLTTLDENVFFGCSSMNNALEFSDNLTSIGASAFASSGFTSITGLDKVESFGEKVFENCTNLSGTLSLTSLTSLEWLWNTFYNCSSLTSVEFGSNFVNIGGGGTFQACEKLVSVSGLDLITELPQYCFHSCSSLTSLDIPRVTTIGSYALDGCEALVSLEANSLGGTIDSSLLPDSKGSLKTLSIDSVTKLDYLALAGFSLLESISLKGVTTLNYGVLNGCTALKELSLPSFAGVFYLGQLFETADGNVLSSEEQATYALTSLDLPLVTSINSASSYLPDMPDLTTLKLPSLESVTYGLLVGIDTLTYLDLSSAELNIVEYKTTPFAGSTFAASQCTLVLNSKYKIASDDYTYVTPNADDSYTNVTWLSITWKEIQFVN
ncbi:MAG: leucine-rich repeat protein [Rikenellaceae bacterium]